MVEAHVILQSDSTALFLSQETKCKTKNDSQNGEQVHIHIGNTLFLRFCDYTFDVFSGCARHDCSGLDARVLSHAWAFHILAQLFAEALHHSTRKWASCPICYKNIGISTQWLTAKSQFMPKLRSYHMSGTRKEGTR